MLLVQCPVALEFTFLDVKEFLSKMIYLPYPIIIYHYFGACFNGNSHRHRIPRPRLIAAGRGHLLQDALGALGALPLLLHGAVARLKLLEVRQLRQRILGGSGAVHEGNGFLECGLLG